MSNLDTGDVYQRVVEVRQKGGEAVLVTVIRCKGSTPRKEGAKMLVYRDGGICGTVGGGIREADVIAMARELLDKDRETERVSVDFSEGLHGESGPVCGGLMELFMEKISGKRALIIGGAGHVGLCLYRIALELEYRVIIIDPRPELNSEERFPKAERLIREFKDGVEGVTVNPGDAVVLVGPGHVSDREMLPSVLKSPAGYIGMIGSKRKQQEVYKHLQNEQNFTDADFQRIYSPVGLDIGSESPAEIAVSIMAEMIRHYKTTQNN